MHVYSYMSLYIQRHACIYMHIYVYTMYIPCIYVYVPFCQIVYTMFIRVCTILPNHVHVYRIPDGRGTMSYVQVMTYYVVEVTVLWYDIVRAPPSWRTKSTYDAVRGVVPGVHGYVQHGDLRCRTTSESYVPWRCCIKVRSSTLPVRHIIVWYCRSRCSSHTTSDVLVVLVLGVACTSYTILYYTIIYHHDDAMLQWFHWGAGGGADWSTLHWHL